MIFMISEKFTAVRQTIDFAKIAVKIKKPNLAIIYLSMTHENEVFGVTGSKASVHSGRL